MKCEASHSKSSCPNVPAGHFGQATSAAGAAVTILPLAPGVNSPITVIAATAMISAPGIRRATSTGVSRIPAMVSSVAGFLSDPIAT